MKHGLWLLGVGALVVASIVGAPTLAQDANAPKGRIAFSKMVGDSAKLCVINADGTGLKEFQTTTKMNLYPSWSPDGKRIAYTGFETFSNMMGDVFIIDADGSNRKRVTGGSGLSFMPAWSPDGKQFLCTVKQGDNFKLHMLNLDGSLAKEFSGNFCMFCFWSPDGKRIGYSRGESMSDNGHLVLEQADGSSNEVLTTVNAMYVGGQGAWSPDGKRIAVMRMSPTLTQGSLLLIEVASKSASKVFDSFAGELREGAFPIAAWSPDGKWLAAVNIKNDKSRIVLISSDGSRRKPLTPESDYCICPAWAR